MLKYSSSNFSDAGKYLSIEEYLRSFDTPSSSKRYPVNSDLIKVIGVGGAGCNTITTLMKMGIQGAECIAVNTDESHLNRTIADKKILIGKDLTKGRGTGGYPEVGEACARRDEDKIEKMLGDAEMVFITYGLGGGTGTGAGPVIAEIAKKKGAIVIGVVTLPFETEGTHKMKIALQGLERLRSYADTVAIISNERLNEVAGILPLEKALYVGTSTLAIMVKGITEIIMKPSLMNVDFADVRSLMSNGDVAAICVGYAEGRNRAEDAVNMALNNPLLEIDLTGATGALIVVKGGSDLQLSEVSRIAEIVKKKMLSTASIKWGADVVEDLQGKLKVLLVVTGVQSRNLISSREKPEGTRPRIQSRGLFPPSEDKVDEILYTYLTVIDA